MQRNFRGGRPVTMLQSTDLIWTWLLLGTAGTCHALLSGCGGRGLPKGATPGTPVPSPGGCWRCCQAPPPPRAPSRTSRLGRAWETLRQGAPSFGAGRGTERETPCLAPPACLPCPASCESARLVTRALADFGGQHPPPLLVARSWGESRPGILRGNNELGTGGGGSGEPSRRAPITGCRIARRQRRPRTAGADGAGRQGGRERSREGPWDGGVGGASPGAPTPPVMPRS